MLPFSFNSLSVFLIFFSCVFFLSVLTGITDNYNSIAILQLQVSFFSSPPPYLLYCLLCHLPSLQPSPVVHILLLFLPFAFCFCNPPHHQSSSVNHIKTFFSSRPSYSILSYSILAYPTLPYHIQVFFTSKVQLHFPIAIAIFQYPLSLLIVVKIRNLLFSSSFSFLSPFYICTNTCTYIYLYILYKRLFLFSLPLSLLVGGFLFCALNYVFLRVMFVCLLCYLRCDELGEGM